MYKKTLNKRSKAENPDLQIGLRYSLIPFKYCENKGKNDNGNYVNKLQQYFGKDKVFGVMQRTAKTNNDINVHFNKQGSIVNIDKLMQNMAMLSELKANRIGFYKDAKDPELALFIQHWKNVIIRDEEDESSGLIYKSISRKGAD